MSIYSYTKEDLDLLNKFSETPFIPSEIKWDNTNASLIYKDIRQVFGKPNKLNETSALWLNTKSFRNAYYDKDNKEEKYNFIKVCSNGSVIVGLKMKISKTMQWKDIDLLDIDNKDSKLVCAKGNFIHDCISKLYFIKQWSNDTSVNIKEYIKKYKKLYDVLKNDYKILIAMDEELQNKTLSNLEYGNKGLFISC